MFWLVFFLLFLLAWVGWRWFCRPIERGMAANAVGSRLANATRGAGASFAHLGSAVGRRFRACAGGGPPQPDRRAWAHSRVALWLPVALPLLPLGLLQIFDGRLAPVLVSPTAAGGSGTVAAVLGEERLLPPPVLPPTAFVGEGGGGLALADRDWSKLDPAFLSTVLVLLDRLERRGHVMTLVEGYRSPARQDQLAASGAGVTRVTGFASRHQYGLAVDLAPLIDGRPVFSERLPAAASAFAALGQEAEALGLVWGGRWSFRDLVHVEAPGRIQDNMTARAADVRAIGR